ncbi:hypothetical protein EQG64_34250 [Streptomyces sp. S6]|nr:hypothetical protein EQG64_34250 [Streptomyces sp. S6]
MRASITTAPAEGQGRQTLVGHGVRTAINVAYRMTFLSHALVTGATDLPSLLIIDSPRKNVGYGTEDQQLIARLYTHSTTSPAPGGTPHTRPHQVIIVDNDLPFCSRSCAARCTPSNSRGTIRWCPDPNHAITVGTDFTLERVAVEV